MNTTRYCPACGSIGPVPPTARNCCPDGNEAVFVPAKVAEQASRGFHSNLDEEKADLLAALEKTAQELQACQAVIHLAGGFDPRYVSDAQSALKDARAAISKAKGGAE